MTQTRETGARIDPTVVKTIEYATMVSEPRLWPDAAVSDAQHALSVQYRRVPTLDELAAKFGVDVVQAVVSRTLANRVEEIKEAMERSGHGHPCHLCASPRADDDPSYEFGLARILEEKTELGDAAVALAMNLLTLPLGFAAGARPGTSTRANVAWCRLVLCQACARSHRSFFGGLRISEADCANHPSWQRLQKTGFDRFLNDDELAKFR